MRSRSTPTSIFHTLGVGWQARMGGVEDGSGLRGARWQLVGQQCVEMHQTRQGPELNIHQSMIDRVVCRNPHAEIRGLPRQVRPDYFDVCRPQRGLVRPSGLAEPLNVRPTT